MTKDKQVRNRAFVAFLVISLMDLIFRCACTHMRMCVHLIFRHMLACVFVSRACEPVCASEIDQIAPSKSGFFASCSIQLKQAMLLVRAASQFKVIARLLITVSVRHGHAIWRNAQV